MLDALITIIHILYNVIMLLPSCLSRSVHGNSSENHILIICCTKNVPR